MKGKAAMAQERWRAFLEEIVGMVTTGQRHFGICNANYCDHMIERIELSIQSCQATTNTFHSQPAYRAVVEGHAQVCH